MDCLGFLEIDLRLPLHLNLCLSKQTHSKIPVFSAYLISQAFPEVAIVLSSEFQDQYINIFLRVPAYIRILD